MKRFLAVDIGGTFLKSGIVDEEGSISYPEKVKAPKSLEGMIYHLYHLHQQHQYVDGLSISCPGAISESGFIHGSSALPYLHGPNIKHMIQDQIGIPVFMENDANCAGYAEIWKGKAQENKDALVIVIGTGVGGALIKNGMIHKGANLHGGEFGYMLIPTNTDTGYQTLSDVGATGALIRRVAQLKQCNPDDLTGEVIFKMAEDGDGVCQKAIDDFFKSLAIGIYNLQYIFDPEVILIGGGISARNDLIDNINEQMDIILSGLPGSTVMPNIEFCQFRKHANLLGAVYGHMRNQSLLVEQNVTSNGVDKL